MTDGAGEGAAHARAALAGNPSDGYGGAVLAVTVETHGARASARRAEMLAVRPASPLVEATVRRFARERAPAALSTEVSWRTTVPRSVGLGGSSAIVIAVLRALVDLYGGEIGPAELAELALATEVQELGIAAGLQDRVTQAYGGLVFMDFDRGSGPARYERLAVDLLPPLLVAWRADASGDSGAVHGPLRDRHASGEPAVVAAMAELGALAREAREALVGSDQPRFSRCVDASFDVRRRLLELDPRHVEMIECARACGAGANYAGSGGAIVAVCCDGLGQVTRLGRELGALGCGVVSA